MAVRGSRSVRPPRRSDPNLAASSPDEILRVCADNLIASLEERVFFKDLESRFLLVSAGWLVGEGQDQSLAGVIGKTDLDIFSRPHALAALEDERRVIETGKPMPAKLERETFEDHADVWVSTTKMPLRDQRQQIVGTWGISRDVTAQVEAERALAHHALHDSVTGLANRVALMDRLTQALVALERRAGRVGVLFIDLDEFKGINDTLGHDAGDQVLIGVAQRITDVARRTDTIARLGGDEFVLLCAQLTDDDDLRLVGDRVVRAIREPLRIAGTDISLTGSIGLADTADPQLEPGELLRQADVALYEAKRAGRNRFEPFDAKLHLGGPAPAGLAAELALAIERAELFVLYQPLFSLEPGTPLRGAEALVRWRHPVRGVILPGDFIPLAERHGLIEQIDSFVLDEACGQLAAWEAAGEGWEDFVISVNVSGRQLREHRLLDRVSSTLERHKIAPTRLCLEITETAMIGELFNANQVLESLSRLGVKIALDDFGTGYSTLAHLQQLHADILKIDRSFIAQLGAGSRDRQIIAAVTAMAHELGMTVVGEGIETDRQLDNLITMDCDLGQGYMLARPLSAAEVASLQVAARTPQAPPPKAAPSRPGRRQPRARPRAHR
ncbi:MAG: EAL domain-containing protein [Solirubrobacteraceae bacterium]|jgi:diguanylate cyclase (GGDEF)-like protein/PAS domain S-box-containing protein